MIKSIIFYLGTILSLIVSLLIGPITIKYLSFRGKEEAKEKFIHKISSTWSKYVMKISFAKITVVGTENLPKNQTSLIVSNHQSYLDIPLIMSVIDIPKGFIAKKELESWPIVSYWMKKIHCIFMDRDNVRKSAESIVEGINLLKGGHTMVIFPEGTRSLGKATHEFKAGSFKLATKSKVPIVPITIDGSYKILSGKFHFVKRCEVIVTIHPMIDVKNLSKDELLTLPSTVENTILNTIKKEVSA